MGELFKAAFPNPLYQLIVIILLSILMMFLGYKTSKSCRLTYLFSEEGLQDIRSCCMICMGLMILIISVIDLFI